MKTLHGELRSLGLSTQELAAGGFSAAELKDVGVGLEDLADCSLVRMLGKWVVGRFP